MDVSLMVTSCPGAGKSKDAMVQVFWSWDIWVAQRLIALPYTPHPKCPTSHCQSVEGAQQGGKLLGGYPSTPFFAGDLCRRNRVLIKK
jgi:hypothetical protein